MYFEPHVQVDTTSLRPALSLTAEAVAKIRQRTPAPDAKVNSKAFDMHLGFGSTYASTFQQNKNAALSELKGIVCNSGITVEDYKAVTTLVKQRVAEVSAQLSSSQICDALAPNKRWLEPCLPLATIIEESLRQAVHFGPLVTALLAWRDNNLVEDNFKAVAGLIHRYLHNMPNF